MDITPEQFEKWLAILGKPTLGVIVFIVIILYRDSVQYFLKAIIDVVKSWFMRK